MGTQTPAQTEDPISASTASSSLRGHTRPARVARSVAAAAFEIEPAGITATLGPQPPLLARRPHTGGEQPEVAGRDDVDGGAHQSGLHHTASLQCAGQVAEGETLEARPEADVGRWGVLRLHTGHPLHRPVDGKPPPTEEQLALEDGSIQLPRGESTTQRLRLTREVSTPVGDRG